MKIGWIDFAREDRAKAMDALHRLQDPMAVDELGIGIIRDAFADAFFPGTSTIQTRAKYFVLIPYILKEATSGKHGYSPDFVLKKVDKLERLAAQAMWVENKEEPGLIGRSVMPKGWVARTPSDIYWNGIRTFGIYTGKHSLSGYVADKLGRREAQNAARLGNKRKEEEGEGDDNEADEPSSAGVLDIGDLYSKERMPSGWGASLEMKLECDEAEFLKKKILSAKDTKDTLLARLLKNPMKLDKFLKPSDGNDGGCLFAAFAKEMSECPDVSDRNKHLLHLAVDFGKLVYAARVFYNVLLGNKRAKEKWDEITKEGLPKYAVLNVDDMMVALKDYLSSARRNDSKFLKGLQRTMQNGDEKGLEKIIRGREEKLKGKRSKLAKAKNGDVSSSSKWVGGTWLDFRLGAAAIVVKDIYEGLGENPC